MKLISDIQNLPKGIDLVQKKVQEWRSVEQTPEDKETIDCAVFRANKRLSDRQMRNVTEEKMKLKFYLRNSVDPVHAFRIKNILDPEKHYKFAQLLKNSPTAKMSMKERMRINTL